MSTRYILAAADSDAKDFLVAQLGADDAGIVYQRDNNTLYVRDPDDGTWGAIGAGVTLASLALAHNDIVVGSAGGLATAVAQSGDVTFNDAGVSAIGAGKVLAAALGVTAGVVANSKAVVADANGSIDKLHATTEIALGGTGIPGGATVATEITKRVTGLADATATDVLTVTIPNAEHNALIQVDILGILGAGGAVGEGEAARTVTYQVTLAKTTGVAAVAGVSAAIGGAAANVAGGQAVTSVVVTASAIAGGTGANTFTIKVAITRASTGATNHIAVVRAVILNANVTGVTLA